MIKLRNVINLQFSSMCSSLETLNHLLLSLVRVGFKLILPCIGTLIGTIGKAFFFVDDDEPRTWSADAAVSMMLAEQWFAYVLLFMVMFPLYPCVFKQSDTSTLRDAFAEEGLDINQGVLRLGLQFFAVIRDRLVVFKVPSYLSKIVYVVANPSAWASPDLLNNFYWAVTAGYVTFGLVLQSYVTL